MKKNFTLFFRLSGLLLLLLLSPGVVLAQEEGGIKGERNMQEKSPDADKIKSADVKRSPVRAILNKITIGANIGYGLNYYHQKLPYTILQDGDNHYLKPQPGSISGYSNWVSSPAFKPLLPAGDADAVVRGDSDTTNLKLTGFGSSLPLNIDLHVVLLDRFRIGGGAGIEAFSVKTLEFKNANSVLHEYNADVSTAIAWRYYGMLGARVYSWGNWDHSVDMRLGKKKFLTQFEGSTGKTFFNLGVTMERNYSEYFRFTFRPAVELFSYTSNKEDLPELKTLNPSLYLQAGVNFNFPRVPRCPIDACHIQLEHVHDGKEFRGQPIHRWQNPKYGQNHPELQRNLKRRKDDTEQRLQRRPARRRHFPNFR